MLNDLYHMLDPVAISAGPITIYWYGLAYVVGALLTAVVMYRTQRRWGFDITVDDLTSVVVGVVFGLIIGARLFYVIFYGDGYYWAHPLEIFATNEGGMSFHGGLVGGIIGGVLVCRMYKLDAWTIADLAVIGGVGERFVRRIGQCLLHVFGEEMHGVIAAAGPAAECGNLLRVAVVVRIPHRHRSQHGRRVADEARCVGIVCGA